VKNRQTNKQTRRRKPYHAVGVDEEFFLVRFCIGREIFITVLVSVSVNGNCVGRRDVIHSRLTS